jgi:hypothetical protein
MAELCLQKRWGLLIQVASVDRLHRAELCTATSSLKHNAEARRLPFGSRLCLCETERPRGNEGSSVKNSAKKFSTARNSAGHGRYVTRTMPRTASGRADGHFQPRRGAYEMISGRGPFAAATMADTVAAILGRTRPASASCLVVPSHLAYRGKASTSLERAATSQRRRCSLISRPSASSLRLCRK